MRNRDVPGIANAATVFLNEKLDGMAAPMDKPWNAETSAIVQRFTFDLRKGATEWRAHDVRAPLQKGLHCGCYSHNSLR